MPNFSAMLAEGTHLRAEAQEHTADREALWMREHSCQHWGPFTRDFCGEDPNECRSRESYGEPFCEKHQVVIDGVVYCRLYARLETAA